MEKWIFKIKGKSQKSIIWICTVLLFLFALIFLVLISRIILIFYKPQKINLSYISLLNILIRSNIGLIALLFVFIISLSFPLWNYFSKTLIESLIIKNFKKWNDNERSNIIKKFFLYLLNIKLKDYEYYLEAEPYNLNLSIKKYPSIFRERIRDIVSINFGIVFIIIFILNFFFDYVHQENYLLIFSIILFLFILSPFLTSWIIPLIWIIRDSRLKYIDNNNNIKEMAEDINKSLIFRLLSFSGVFFAISYFIDYNSSLGIPLIENIFFTAYTLLVISLIIGMLSISIGINYLAIFHEKNVNRMRYKLVEKGYVPLKTSFGKDVEKKMLEEFIKLNNINSQKGLSKKFKFLSIFPFVLIISIYILSLITGSVIIKNIFLIITLISIPWLIFLFLYLKKSGNKPLFKK